MSLIWPGLDLIRKSYVAHRDKTGRNFSYPFQLYPPAPRFDRGKLEPMLMEHILHLEKELRPNVVKGCRLQVETIQLRAMTCAARINREYVRFCKRAWKISDKERRSVLAVTQRFGPSLRMRQTAVIDLLVALAKRALAEKGLRPPSEKRLRQLMRQQARTMRDHGNRPEEVAKNYEKFGTGAWANM